MKSWQKVINRHLLRRGIFHNYWVLNDYDEMLFVLTNEPTHGIMTDCPTMLKKLLQDIEAGRLPDEHIRKCENPKAYMRI